MYTYKMTIQYDGTNFSGFQKQKRERTIQGELEKVLEKIFNHKIKTYGAGRTDAGVHALSQVVHFKSSKLFPPEKLKKALNSLLPTDISVLNTEMADKNFHARFSAKRRKYIYIVDNSPHPHAILTNKVYWYPHQLNIQDMKKGAMYFQGTHNFSLFAKGLKEIKNTIRTVEVAKVFTLKEKQIEIPIPHIPSLVFFYFKAPSFLHSQVRFMVSSLLEVGRGRISPEKIGQMLKDENNNPYKITNIPGRGLYLVDVEY